MFPEYENARIGHHNEAKHSSPTKSNYGKKKFQMNSFIIQKYIEKPLLVYKRKFDIRVWVLVSNTGKCYFFKEGYLRTSGSEFQLDSNNADDQYVHLTNNAIQKHSKTYGEFEDGNQMSFKQFQAYIDAHYSDSRIDFYRDCLPKMKAMIKHSLLAARKKLNPNNIELCFELFGYDFIMDEDFNLWLIEVNTNPCLEESSKLLKYLLRRMVEDMIKLEIDPHFPNPRKKKTDSEEKDGKYKHKKGYKKNKHKKKLKRKLSFNKTGKGKKDNLDPMRQSTHSTNFQGQRNQDLVDEDLSVNHSPRQKGSNHLLTEDDMHEDKLSSSMFIVEHNLYTDICEGADLQSDCTY